MLDVSSVEWRVLPGLTPYDEAVALMETRAQSIREGAASEQVWLVEHPPIYTAGTSAREGDVLQAKFPVHATGRGGQVTYHGPGQRVAYAMLDLQRLFAPTPPDLRRYIQLLEAWLINTLAQFSVEGFLRAGRVGVWVQTEGGEAKIAAIGVRVKRWVSYHGVALNVVPDLSHYAGIVPCGIKEYGVTSLRALGISATMEEVDVAMKAAFDATLGNATGAARE